MDNKQETGRRVYKNNEPIRCYYCGLDLTNFQSDERLLQHFRWHQLQEPEELEKMYMRTKLKNVFDKDN